MAEVAAPPQSDLAVSSSAAGGLGDRQKALESARAAIEESSFPDEHLRILASSEVQVVAGRHLQGGLQAPANPLPREARRAAVTLLCHLSQSVGSPTEGLAQAVALLDIYCCRALGAGDEALLPSACLAIWKVLSKANQAHAPMNSAMMKHAAAFLRGWLVTLGYSGEQAAGELATGSTVREQTVLDVLRWQINPPTVESWMRAFCHRLDAATHHMLTQFFDWILDQGLVLARAILQSVTMFELPPYQFAVGLLCHGLVATKLLPLEMICPRDRAQHEDWKHVFLQGEWGMVPECSLPSRYQKSMFDLLALATDSVPESLQREAMHFVTIARDALCTC